MEVFDHLEWTYNGAFEELFGLGKGEFEQKFSKNSNARGGCPGRCLSFDLTGTLQQPPQIKPPLRVIALRDERNFNDIIHKMSYSIALN